MPTFTMGWQLCRCYPAGIAFCCLMKILLWNCWLSRTHASTWGLPSVGYIELFFGQCIFTLIKKNSINFLMNNFQKPISLGLIRSDIMLETRCGDNNETKTKCYCCWKQVEINTIASGFGHLGPISKEIQRCIFYFIFFILVLPIWISN